MGLEVWRILVNRAFEVAIGRLESRRMRAATRERLEGLTALHRLTSAEQREAAWRRGMATLARAVVDERRPVPLEGLDPDALLRSLEVAIEGGLVEKLDWLSGPAAAARSTRSPRRCPRAQSNASSGGSSFNACAKATPRRSCPSPPSSPLDRNAP